MGEVIVELYVEAFIITGACVYCLISILKKRRWICWENLIPELQQRVKRNEKKINIVLKCIIGLCLSAMFITRVVPVVRDIPNVMQGHYLEAEGKVVSWNYSDETKKELRSIAIIDAKTNKRISLEVYSTGVHKGEYIKVTYLPISEVGTIEERR